MLKLAIAIVLIAVLVTGVMYFSINYNADYQYQREFGTYVVVATQSAGLNRTWANCLTVWQHMNTTFPNVEKWNETYNVIPLFGLNADLKFENTIAAENDYFQGLESLYHTDLKLLQQSTGFVTEQQLVYEFRNEMNAYGGSDWAIKGAYYIQNFPAAYWSWIYYAILWVIAIIGAFVAFVYTPSRSRY
jgi:hypothetical protein